VSVHPQREAAEIREEWLSRTLSSWPADRPATEAAISGLYDLLGLDPPRFHWTSSPVTALETVPPGVGPRPPESVSRLSEWPLPQRFSADRTALFLRLDERFRGTLRTVEPTVRFQVTGPLAQSWRDSHLDALRAADRWAPRHSWYQTLCPSRVAHYDALRRLGAVTLTADEERLFDCWATLARSCCWWWPRERVCVVSDRPAVLRVEVWQENGIVRLHEADGPAVRYRDGWEVYAWHGTQVPSWVITDPRAWRIARETNVEVRRCAIEHVGWASYIEEAGLVLVGSAPDPGNPGSELRLYHVRDRIKVLLAVNGSVERDGHRRRYGLTVPGHFTDPIAAAGWTYGLSGTEYSRLARRT
jgi:uncharacterized protein DUF6745